MRRTIWARLGLAVGLALLTAGGASAQRATPYARPNYGPGYRPSLSPYLNLIRSGNPAANYYLGTRPEVQRRANANQFNREIGQLQTDVLRPPPVGRDADIFTPIAGTGHPTVFGSVGSYFGNPAPQVNRPPLPR